MQDPEWDGGEWFDMTCVEFRVLDIGGLDGWMDERTDEWIDG